MPRCVLFSLLALLCGVASASDPFDVTPAKSKLPRSFLKLADVKFEVIPAKAKRGETVTIQVTVDLKPEAGGYTYPFFPANMGQPKNVLKLPAGDLALLADNADPAGAEPKPDDFTTVVFKKSVTWAFKAQVSPTAKPGKYDIDLGPTTTGIQVCNEVCITADGSHLPFISFEVLDGPPVTTISLAPVVPVVPPVTPPRGPAPKPDGPTASEGHGVRKDAKPIETVKAELAAIQASIVKPDAAAGTGGSGSSGDGGLWGFVLTAAAWGLISLITPCVFPMIPITVSIFLKHAHGSFRERIKLAGVYCLTIISVLGVSAFALLKVMASLAVHPVTNVLLGVLFFVLALSLFGMYELTLPNFMVRRLQSKQAKGGVVGTIFGALAFTVISFTCVAPFLGGFAGIAAADSASGSLISLPTMKEVLGGLAFATAFAAPFFVLALVPGLLKALPKSGGWLDSVKVVMGFLELAAALKFLRTAELGVFSPPQYFTYELVLAGWVAIVFACGLYLLNAYRLPHDEEKQNIGVPRLMFALLFLGLGFYLLPATFKPADGKAPRPAGAVYEWVEAFLLPDGEDEGTDLKAAIDRARKSGKPVFLDFTGVTCTNCKYNENSVFTRPGVRAELNKFERVQLYTDWLPASAYASDPGDAARTAEGRANGKFQEAVFGDIALPMYVVLMPTADGKVKMVCGTVKGVPDRPYEGKIGSPDAFTAWLKESLEKAKK